MDASHKPPTGDLACNPGMCPDWELNQQPFGSQTGTQSTEAHQPGQKMWYLKENVLQGTEELKELWIITEPRCRRHREVSVVLRSLQLEPPDNSRKDMSGACDSLPGLGCRNLEQNPQASG